MTDNIKNMELYRNLETPAEWATKKIEGGRLRGKTDINPQWRIEALTEQFGPCGIGWKFTIDKQWTEKCENGEVMCFCNISLFIKVDGQWSEAIPGTGGNMLTEKEKAGMHNSDEGFKMALTDALSVASKMIGMAALVYRNFKETDSKYQKGGDTNSDSGRSAQQDDPDMPDCLCTDEQLLARKRKRLIDAVIAKSKCSEKEAEEKLDKFFMGKTGKKLKEITDPEVLEV